MTKYMHVAYFWLFWSFVTFFVLFTNFTNIFVVLCHVASTRRRYTSVDPPSAGASARWVRDPEADCRFFV